MARPTTPAPTTTASTLNIFPPRAGLLSKSERTGSCEEQGSRLSAKGGERRLLPRFRLVRGARACRWRVPIVFVDVVAGPNRGLRAVLKTKLSQDRLHVHFYRRLGNHQIAGDNLVRCALHQHAQDQGFPARQRGYPLPRPVLYLLARA